MFFLTKTASLCNHRTDTQQESKEKEQRKRKKEKQGTDELNE